MEKDIPFLITLAFGGAFMLTLLAGMYLYKHDRSLFGPHPDHPGETEGSRAYNRMQVWAVWAHAVVLTALFTLALH